LQKYKKDFGEKMKQLTIAIPSYNVEKYLAKCLDSMCGIDDRLEVIVVNDGSKDRTSEIAHSYAEKYPLEVKVIDKENGGHGSGINAGLDAATGRYYKVVDADDWITTENLKGILDKLENTDVDAVIMGYQTVNITSGAINQFIPDCSSKNRRIDIIKLLDKYDEISTCIELSALCYNTEFFRKTGLRMSENVYYEDQEYAILPFIYAHSIMLIDDRLYEYRIGDSNQSVSMQNIVKRAGNLEAVVKHMIDYYVSCKPIGKARTTFLQRRLSVAVTSLYATLLVKNYEKKEGRKKAAAFRDYLLHKDSMIVKMTDGRYKLLKKASHFKHTAKVYNSLFNSESYSKFVKKWAK